MMGNLYSVFGLCAAIAFIALGIGLFIKIRRFRAQAEVVDATVIDAEEFGDVREDGLTPVYVSYNYTASDGRTIHAKRRSLRRRMPPIGSRRTMLVDPENPGILRPPGITEFVPPAALFISGAALLIFVVTLVSCT